MAEDHYRQITQRLIDQSNEYAIQNAGFASKGKFALRYKHKPMGEANGYISFHDMKIDMADYLSQYIRKKGVGKKQGTILRK